MATPSTTLLVDNYDSYTFNLFQLIATVSGREPVVVQNDDFGADWDTLCKTLKPGKDFHQVVISPGPGSPHTPSDVGLSAGAARDASVPVFGVCLGHQLLAATFGARVVRGQEPMHGRVTKVNVLDSQDNGLFKGIPSAFDVVRYHSLVVQEDTLPENVRVTARSDDGAIMALAVSGDRISVGVQFHPESICSEHGADLVRNFLKLSVDFWARQNGTQMGQQPVVETSYFHQSHTEPETTSTPVAQLALGAHRVVVEPVSYFTANDSAPAARISTEKVFTTLFPVDNAAERSETRFWLDSATRDLDGGMPRPGDPSQTRFSFMGNANGPLAELVEFYVDPESRAIADSTDHGRPPHELRAYRAASDGTWSQPQCTETEDVFEFLAHDMESKRHDADFLVVQSDPCGPESSRSDGAPRPLQDWDLPFALASGYVGFFGYGLRRFCGVKKTLPRRSSVSTDSAESETLGDSLEEKTVSRKRARAPSPATVDADSSQSSPAPGSSKTQCCEGDTHVPDASFLFADRLVAWDHDTNMCWLVTFENDEASTKSAQTEWRVNAHSTLKALARGSAAPETADGTVSVGPGVVSVRQTAASSSLGAGPLRSTVDDPGYIDLVTSCIEEIRAGETYEVCLTKQLSLEDKRIRERAFDTYKMLRQANPAPYAAFLEVKAPGSKYEGGEPTSNFAVCCSSPERFLRASAHGVVESKPIKGTIHRGETPEEDAALAEELRTSVKDRAENLMIVDLVRNDLGKVCKVGTVSVPKLMQIESFTTVHQLVSTVRGQLSLDEDDFGRPHAPRAQRFPPTLRAIQAAFPGGSMTGAPKLRTMQIIDQLEPKERGVYSGALGFVSLTGASDLNIVIRTAVVTPAGISVGTGGAIVALSDPQGELDETKLKANRLQTVFSSFLGALDAAS
ncbi:Aminodeoxychorismate synthase, chloroplastic [Hondaea fermentalgiana]|uniref:aminodeoxychorismate synthase n=1 Tax=Hondaea fermentalgiana TaxID=2315210 RepID=A0A2R5G746_9STRA|nr:Aminodeoxychorismate synthase, chloroplastic [Hondaea fermentalgiana]|eukprot:GBG26820.1 Aminodeoxychorismate synthase, chloroplastic [Hondaea fermentalgiana]